MDWDKPAQIRHAALICWPILLNGQRQNIMDLENKLELFGYHGMIQSLSAQSVIHGWSEAGWIIISPNGQQLRLTEAGIEQFHQWKEADELWNHGPSDNIKHVKRFIAGQPFMNLRKISQLIGTADLTSVHDPYTTENTLLNLHKLKGIGVHISQNLRLLTGPKAGVAAASVASFLQNLNTEIGCQWELRSYIGTKKPHRRFLVLQDMS